MAIPGQWLGHQPRRHFGDISHADACRTCLHDILPERPAGALCMGDLKVRLVGQDLGILSSTREEVGAGVWVLGIPSRGHNPVDLCANHPTSLHRQCSSLCEICYSLAKFGKKQLKHPEGCGPREAAPCAVGRGLSGLLRWGAVFWVASRWQPPTKNGASLGPFPDVWLVFHRQPSGPS